MSGERGTLRIRRLVRRPYEPLWREMQRHTDERGAETGDELWLTEHEPVFTLGMNADPAHVLVPGGIPVVAVDRGGQVTYHGPGQLMVYPLIDMRRLGLGVRALVTALEQSVVALLAVYGIDGTARREAPGVYVGGRKVASVGLRVRRGASYHGMAVNVAMDLEPFTRINPCGYEGLEVTDLASLGGPGTLEATADELVPRLCEALGLAPVEGDA